MQAFCSHFMEVTTVHRRARFQEQLAAVASVAKFQEQLAARLRWAGSTHT
jgi:hypothetical protein